MAASRISVFEIKDYEKQKQSLMDLHQRITTSPWRMRINLGDVFNNTAKDRTCNMARLSSHLEGTNTIIRILQNETIPCQSLPSERCGLTEQQRLTIVLFQMNGRKMKLFFIVDKEDEDCDIILLVDEQSEDVRKFFHTITVKFIIDGQEYTFD